MSGWESDDDMALDLKVGPNDLAYMQLGSELAELAECVDWSANNTVQQWSKMLKFFNKKLAECVWLESSLIRSWPSVVAWTINGACFSMSPDVRSTRPVCWMRGRILLTRPNSGMQWKGQKSWEPWLFCWKERAAPFKTNVL